MLNNQTARQIAMNISRAQQKLEDLKHRPLRSLDDEARLEKCIADNRAELRRRRSEHLADSVVKPVSDARVCRFCGQPLYQAQSDGIRYWNCPQGHMI
jgi:hypothetical protein